MSFRGAKIHRRPVPRARHDLCRAALRDGAADLSRRPARSRRSEIFMGDFPLMTEERHVHHQRRRARRRLASSCARPASTSPPTRTRRRAASSFAAKLIPNRGAWLEFETSNKDVISVKVDRKRKMPVTILLRAIGVSRRDEADCDRTASCSRRRHQPRSPLSSRRRSTRTPTKTPGRGADRALPRAAPRRPADAATTRSTLLNSVLQPTPLRPGARWAATS